MIHVCYSLYDRDGSYSKFTGTSILSVFENVSILPPSVTIHILHDNTLTQDNREKFIYLAGRYCQIIKFYNLEELCPDKMQEFQELISAVNSIGRKRAVGALYRLAAPYVIREDINKILYFDSDIVVNMDVAKFWKIDLNDAPIAAVPELDGYGATAHHGLVIRKIVDGHDYFNSGVLIINLSKWRQEEQLIREGMKFRAENTDLDCSDQDILNWCFSKNYFRLPMNFNITVGGARIKNDFKIYDRVCHYVSSPFGGGVTFDTSDSYNKLFMKFFLKTPWFSEDTLNNLYNQTLTLYDELYSKRQDFARKITAFISGKERAFFVLPEYIDEVKNLFYVNPHEEIILAEKDILTLENFFKSMVKAKGKKIFFVFVNQYLKIRDLLLKAGFFEWQDFINAEIFLPDYQEEPFNPYSLLKAM